MFNKKTWQLLATLVAACLLLGMLPAFAESPVVHRNPTVGQEIAHDVSLPVRDYPDVKLPQFGTRLLAPNPLRPTRTVIDPNPGPNNPLEIPTVTVQKKLSFDGVSHTGFAPPDTNGAVGSTQYVQTVNLSYAVYDKTTGSVIQATKALSTLWTGFGTNCKGVNFSDPVVNWDKAAQRWVISLLAFNNTFSSNSMCYAVSTSTDATGTYNRYEFTFGANLTDYPKTGVWPDAYYFTADIFPNGGFFTGVEFCAFDRSAMLAGTTATSVCFGPTGFSQDFAVLPPDMDGATAPPTGEAAPFLEAYISPTIRQFDFHVDFVNPTNSTLTGPISVTVPSWTFICSTTRACVPQPSPGEKVDALSDRLMYRLAYRNFGDHEALVAVHTVKPTQGTATAASRWYEFRATTVGSNNYSLFQSGTLQNQSASLWLGSIAMDKTGDIALGVSTSSATIDPGMRLAARAASDPKGTLGMPISLINGTGVQTNTQNRWGDYSAMQIDPTDDCTFYYTNEYIKTTGSFLWNTHVNSFKIQGCH
jgi:hypothetical protein